MLLTMDMLNVGGEPLSWSIIIKRRFFAILQKRYVCKALSLCTSMLWRMVF